MATQNESGTNTTKMEHSRPDPTNSNGTRNNSPHGSDPAQPGDNGMQVESDNDSDLKPHAPMQKRRRVTRACDECRRKKIKCDGKQPCTHCTVYSYGKYRDESSYLSLTHPVRLHLRPTFEQKAEPSSTVH